jgi:hypothetical protein
MFIVRLLSGRGRKAASGIPEIESAKLNSVRARSFPTGSDHDDGPVCGLLEAPGRNFPVKGRFTCLSYASSKVRALDFGEISHERRCVTRFDRARAPEGSKS